MDKQNLQYGQIIVRNGQIGTLVYYSDKKLMFKPYDISNYSYSDLLEIDDRCVIRSPTEDEKDFFISYKFPWGKVIKIHKISNIQIIESDESKISNSEDKNKHSFSIFIEHKSIGYGSDSLDQAIIVGLAKKYGDSDSARHAIKLLNMDKR